MRRSSFLLAIIMTFVLISPQGLASSEFLSLSRTADRFEISGITAPRSNVTLRSIYFGADEPNFPNGVDNYEISAEDVRDGNVNINYFNVVAADNNGAYSAEFKAEEYGYYLITAASAVGDRANRLYNYRKTASDLQPPENAGLENTDISKVFEADGEKFILLDMDGGELELMTYSDCGVSNGYGLDEFLDNAASMLPSAMRDYVTGVSIPDSNFFEKYGEEVGIADGVGYFGDDTWRVLKNNVDNRDSAKYEAGSINELSNGLYMENISFGSGVHITERNDNKETVIEFTAPSDGEYGISTTLSGAGSIKAQLSALLKEKTFDNNSIMTILYDGTSVTKDSTVSLSKGDKLYLHLYPTLGEVGLDFKISNAGKTYDLSKFGAYENKWWTAGGDGESRYAYSMNTLDFGSVVSVDNDSLLFVRPVIKIKDSFMTACKIDIQTAGAAVLSAMRENFKREELASIYDEYELNTIYDEFGGFSFEVLPFTDEDGNEAENIKDGVLRANIRIENSTDIPKKMSFILAVYSGGGKLLATDINNIAVDGNYSGEYSVSSVVSGSDSGAYAKSFLWDSAGKMRPVSEIKARETVVARLCDVNAENHGGWSFYTKPVGETNHDLYVPQNISGARNVSTSSNLPFAYWTYRDAENKAYIRPEKTGDQVIEYTIPHKGNWTVDITWRNIGVDNALGGDGGRLSLSYLPKGDSDDSRIFRNLNVSVSSETPVSNSYRTTLSANGGDRIILSAYANYDGYGDCWEIKYTISETDKKGKEITENYKIGLPEPTGTDTASSAAIKENTVWIGVDGTFGDSEAMEEKILYFKRFIPNLGVVLMTARPDVLCNSDFFEENGIPVIVQSYGAGFEDYIEANNAWEWDWNNKPLNSSHWQDLSGTAHAFAMPHYATKEVFSRIAKSAAESGFSGYGFPDCVWMWGARGISGYNPETVKAFVDDLCERDSGLKCDDGVWYFHDYYRYYTGSDTLITPQDLNINSWEEYSPLSQARNTELKNAGVDTTAHWAVFDMLCHYEWLKFAQYIGGVSKDNGGICQIMINPEYYPDGVDYLFLNKLVGVDMTEDEFFGNTDYLDGAYYRFNYLTKYNATTKTGGVMEAGGGGNGGAYYTDEIAYLTAFELGSLGAIDHLEADFMYQNSGYSKERDGQIMSYGMGFSDAKSLNLEKRKADFTVVSSRNQSRPWAADTEWKPWSLRLGYDGNTDFYLAKMGYNFEGISQEGMDAVNGGTVVFSPHRVTQSAWEDFIGKLSAGDIKTGIISSHRFDTAVTDKLKTVEFSSIAPEYNYSEITDIGLPGHIKDLDGNNLTSSRKSISGGIAAPRAGDETVLSFRTITKSYPLAVKRKVGSGEMYVLLFDDSLAENYEISEAVYGHIMSILQIKPMFKSVENSGTLIDGFTETQEHSAAVSADLGVSARVYQSGELTAAGIQNSLARVMAQSSLTSTGQCAPYNISGSTSAKILMSPSESYKYLAVPSMAEGTVTADEQGYVTLSFDDTSHEIFFLLPQNSGSDFDGIKNMQSNRRAALDGLTVK